MAPPRPPTTAAANNVPTTAASNKKTKTNNNNNATTTTPPREYNPRWKGYCYIMLSSLIQFTAISNIDPQQHDVYDDDDNDDQDAKNQQNREFINVTKFQGDWGVALHFGIVMFCFAFFVLVTDRLQIMGDNSYTKAYDGKLEGYCLVLLCCYSIVGVGYITQVGGIAYVALNVYFASWLNLLSCLYTFNRWSSDRDILSFEEMTSVSATLKSWYLVFFFSLVVMGTSLNMLGEGHVDAQGLRDAGLGIAFGLVTTLMAFVYILVHYNLFFDCLEEGGLIELSAIVLTLLLWIVGAAVLTQDAGIAATIIGTIVTRPPPPKPLPPLETLAPSSLPSAFPSAFPSLSPSSLPPMEDYPQLNTTFWDQFNLTTILDDCTITIQGVIYTCSDALLLPAPESTSPTISPAPSMSRIPSMSPSVSNAPSISMAPSAIPSVTPTANPTESTIPSSAPSMMPSVNPTHSPSVSPAPSMDPTATPSTRPTSLPSFSLMPTAVPTHVPSTAPTATEVPSYSGSPSTIAPTKNITTNATTSSVAPTTIALATDTTSSPPASEAPPTAVSSGETRRSRRWLSSEEEATNGNGEDDNTASDDEEFYEYTGTATTLRLPGSNLYMSVWICLLCSLNLLLRWKAQQALQFAQAQQAKAMAQHNNGSHPSRSKNEKDDDDDDDDLEAFEDASTGY